MNLYFASTAIRTVTLGNMTAWLLQNLSSSMYIHAYFIWSVSRTMATERDVMIFYTYTFTNWTISSESQFTSTDVRTVIVGTISVFITWVGIRRTLIDVWNNKKGNLIIEPCRKLFIYDSVDLLRKDRLDTNNVLPYLGILHHLRWIPVYKYSYRILYCWCNQRFHHK